MGSNEPIHLPNLTKSIHSPDNPTEPMHPKNPMRPMASRNQEIEAAGLIGILLLAILFI